MTYPPPPWPMVGPVLIVPGPGRALLLGDWREGDGLQYSELATLHGPLVRRGRPAFWVDTMHVDLTASREGGRRIWGVPKELATFAWRDAGCTVTDDDGVLAGLSWSAPQTSVPLPAWGFFAGDVDGPPRRARLAGTVRIGPVIADVHAPRLGFRGRRLALAGHADLRAEAPRLWSA